VDGVMVAPAPARPDYGLRLPGVVTATSLELPEGLAFDEWEHIGAILDHVGGAWQWWYGDWYRYGERHYGEAHTQALGPDDPAYQTKANAAWVAASFCQLSRRRESLSFSHHAEVAALEPQAQEALLMEAERERWGVRELRQAARRMRPSKHALGHQQRLMAHEEASQGRDLSAIPESLWDDITSTDAASYLRALAQHAPGGVADVCVTSPPYWAKRKYTGDPLELGQEAEPGAYVERLVEIVNLIGDVLVPGGYLFLNLGDTYANDPGHYRGNPERARGVSEMARLANGSAIGGRVLDVAEKSVVGVPWRVLLALTLEYGWRCANVVCWAKPNHQPENVHDRLTQTWEPILLLTRSEHAYLRRERIEDTGDLWTLSAGRHGDGAGHFAPFPEALVERAIALSCPEGGVVLDPFAGSGTTLTVATRMGRRFLGCDLALVGAPA
jgi:DNA modification methylase